MTALKATPELVPASGTPGHTIGPFFHGALGWAAADTAEHPAHGDILIEGTVVDGTGAPLPAWMIEAWVPQSEAAETQAGLPAPGLRRRVNDAGGTFSFRVPQPAPGEPAAFVTLFGLGLTRHFHTAVFLPEGATDAASPLLAAVPDSRRATLFAERVGEAHYRWIVRTQGERETVFLDYR